VHPARPGTGLVTASPRLAQLAAILNPPAALGQLPTAGAPASPPPGSGPVAQRVVLSRVATSNAKGETWIRFYSSYDPTTLYETQAKAQQHDDELRATSAAPAHDARYPTNFTYHQIKSENAMTATRQGPHSLSHASLALRLHRYFASPGFDLRALRDQQVLTPEQFEEQFEREAPRGINRHQLARANLDYRMLYAQLDALIAQKEGYDKMHAYELMMRLLQMNPYSAYGKSTPSQSRIKGKGERADDRFNQAFDPKAKFRNRGGFDEFKRMRQELYSSESEDDSEIAGPHAGDAAAAAASSGSTSGDQGKGQKVHRSEESSGTAMPHVRAVVYLENLAEADRRSWNVGDQFEIVGEPGYYYVWQSNHHAGTGIVEGEYVRHLKGG